MLYDPVSRKLYVAVGNDGGTRANTVTVIDPDTGTIERSDFIGSEPWKLVLSDRSKYLYVSLGRAIRRYEIATHTAGLRFPLEEGLECNGLASYPGDPDSVGVSRVASGLRDGGLVVYTNGTPKPAWVFGGHHLGRGIAPSRFYGYDNSGGDGLINFRFTPDGARGIWVVQGWVYGFTAIRSANGLLYEGGDFGHRTLDAEARDILGSYPTADGTIATLPSPERGVLYALRDGVLDVFDMRTYVKTGEFPIPNTPRSRNGDYFIQWGEDGLAYLANDSIVILKGGLGARMPGVDLALTRTILSGDPSAREEFRYRLTVRNQSAVDCSEAGVTDFLPWDVEVLEVSASQGDAFVSNGILRGQLGPIAARGEATVDVRARLHPEHGVAFSAVARPFEPELAGEDNLSLFDFLLRAPTGLRVAPTGEDAATLDWEDSNLNEQGFRIERARDSGGFAPLAAYPTETHFVDTGLLAGHEYRYRVVAFSERGDSVPSETVTIGSLRLVPPGDVAASPMSPSGVALTWSDSNEGLLGYRVERARGDGAFGPLPGIVPAGSRELQDVDVSPNRTYRYRVIALAEGQESAASAIARALTLPAAPESLRAAAPADGTPPRGRHAIELGWTDPNDPPCAHRVERSANGTDWSVVASSVAAGTNAYTDTGLPIATRYFYRVVGVNASGASPASMSAEVWTLGALAPKRLSAVLSGPQAIDLEWEDADPEPVRHRVERARGDGVFAAAAVLDAGIVRYHDEALQPNNAYRYRIIALHETRGESDPSEVAAALTIPAAAGGLRATAPAEGTPPRGRHEVDLTWTDSNDPPCAHRVERSENGADWSIVAAAVPAGTTSFTDTGLAIATRYLYRVIGFNPSGDSEAAAPSEATTLGVLPPKGLTATLPEPQAVDLEWEDTDRDPVRHRIERALGDGEFKKVDDLPLGSRTYRDEGLLPNNRYRYRVIAWEAVRGDSEPSGIASVLTFPVAAEAVRAAAPSDGTPPRGRHEVELTWTDSNDPGCAHRVERSADGRDWSVVAVSVDAGTSRYTDTGLQIATHYYYRVIAVNASGESPASASAGVWTLGVLPPKQLSAVLSGRQTIDLEWEDADPEPVRHRVERARGDGEFSPVAQLAAGSHSHRDHGLLPNNLYHYRVVALHDVRGESEPSEVASALTVPAAPEDLAVVVPADEGRTTLRLSWQDPNEPLAATRLDRAVASGEFSALVDLPAGTEAYSDTGLSPGTSYRYRIRAVNAAGPSPPSDEVSATTLGGLPAQPVGLRARVLSATAIRLLWKDQSTNETGFTVVRVSGSQRSETSLPPDTTRFDALGLMPLTTYRFEVASFNADGKSAAARIKATTPGSGTLEVTRLLSFGTIRIGKQRTRDLLIRNASKGERLWVTVEGAKPPFALVGGKRSLVLAAGRSVTLQVRFKPGRRGTVSSSMTVRSSDEGDPVVKVRLIGSGG
jgi:fibronectin type 3 domain-containing protein